MIETRRLKNKHPNNFKFCAVKKNYTYLELILSNGTKHP